MTIQPPRGPEYAEGRHWVSSLNFDPVARAEHAFPSPLVVYDSTLRKMLLASGTRPSVDDLLTVAEALVEVGIRQEIFNVDWWGDPEPDELEFETCRALLRGGFGFELTVYSDSFVGYGSYDVERTPVSGPAVVDRLRDLGVTTMALPMSDPRDESDRARRLERLAATVEHARAAGVRCVVGLVDAGRMDAAFLERAAAEAVRLGAVRVDLADQSASLSPEAMKLLVRRVRERLPAEVPIGLHAHNFFGLGSALALAACSAGAHPDLAVNGIAYRSGHAALEEVVLSLELLYGVPTGLRLDRLQRLSELVAERAGLPLHPLKPITGPHAYVIDLPAWVIPYLEQGPGGFPPPGASFAPELVGARMRPVWGKRFSEFVVRTKLRAMGLEATDAQVDAIRGRIAELVGGLDAYPRWLDEERVETICREAVAGAAPTEAAGRSR